MAARLERRSSGKPRGTAVLAVLALVVGLLGLGMQLQSVIALTGSSFEILDGNESVEDEAGGKIDWSSPEVIAGQVVLNDESQTSTDESISGDEDATTVKITAGSIQPNKSDIVKVRSFAKRESGKDFLYLAFDRFPTTNGVMAIDFELNQKSQGTVPDEGEDWVLNRTADDKLIVFEMVNGGTVPIISMMSWITSGTCEKPGQTAPCWGTKQLLTPQTTPAAEGSVNQTGDIVFGEMAIDLELADIFETGECTSFASLYVKSRSSGSSLANQISDLVKPKETTVSNCGSITVTKDVTGPTVAGDQASFDFEVSCPGYDLDPATAGQQTTRSFSLADDGSRKVSDIPVGADCTVTEAAPSPASHWSTTYKVDAGAVTDGRVATVDDVVLAGHTVAFVNARQTGSLTISKATTGGTGTFDFTVDCDGTAYDRTTADPVQITDSGSATINGIPIGTSCTVTEVANPQFSSVRTPTSGQVTIDANGETVSFTNTRLTGSLTIAKTTTGGTGTFLFTVDCDGTQFDRTGADKVSITGTDTHTITGIPTGTSCTVTEDADPLFTSTRTPTNGTVTIDADGETVSFTNVRKTGTLTVTKTTTGGTGTFRFEVECDGTAYDRKGADRLTIVGSGQATVTGIPTGTECTVTETTDPLFTSTRTPTNGTVTIDEDGETVSFTNVRNTGVLTVSKTTTGGTGTFRFAVDCSDDAFDRLGDDRLTIVGSGTATITGIPTGTTCTVTETADPLFDSTRTPSNGQVTIDADGETVSFTNVRKTGSLTVSKTTTGGTGAFRFEVDCSDDAFDRTGADRLTVVGSGTATITGIPTGTTCTVTETADPLFDSTRTPSNGQVTIDADGETVSFTNVRKTGSLTITKATSGGNGGFTFAVDCSDDTFDRAAVVVTTTAGAGSSSPITGIPTGTACTVTETVPAGWAAVGGVSRDVTIDVDGETAAFSNRKLVPGIDVTKAASAPVVHNGTAVTYTYVVTNTGETPLSDVTVVDDKCATVTGPAAGNDVGGDDVLGLTETWTYTCTSTLTATTTNVVTATGTDLLDADVSDTATATVTVIKPLIAIDKAPSATSVEPGTTVVYTYTVTNPGDVPLTAVTVSDDKCSPVTLARGDANGDGILQVTETWVFTCSQVQTGAIDTLTNVGTARGLDPLGAAVTSNDTVTISVVAPLVLAQPPAPAPAPVATAPVTLPRTGIDVRGWLQLGGSLLLLGVALLLTSRSRRTA